MADALYYVRLSGSRCGQTLNNKVNAVIVVADDDAGNVGAAANANARAAAATATGGPDGVWADAVVTELDATLAAPILLATTD